MTSADASRACMRVQTLLRQSQGLTDSKDLQEAPGARGGCRGQRPAFGARNRSKDKSALLFRQGAPPPARHTSIRRACVRALAGLRCVKLGLERRRHCARRDRTCSRCQPAAKPTTTRMPTSSRPQPGAMATTVDLTFDRAVDLVHSLPKTSPIQIGYEECV